MVEEGGQAISRFRGLFVFLSFFIISVHPLIASAEGKSTLTGIVRDVAGKPVEGAEVFVYNGPQVKRTADFISPRTDNNGRFSFVLPKGKYWAVARLRKGAGRFGPLMPGDKHSGDPVEIELSSGAHAVNFIVADLKEAAGLSRKKPREDYVTIKGRILDRHGNPVRDAYAVANRVGTVAEIPEYLSSWTDDEGRYTLYLPRGKYSLGPATVFPPGSHFILYKEIILKRDIADVDIVIKSGDR